MNNEHMILAAGWILFCVLHSVLASLWCKQIIAGWLGAKFVSYRIVYSLFAFFSFSAIIIYQLSIESKIIFTSGPTVKIIGWLLFSCGFIIISVCGYKYFSRVTGINWLIRNDAKQILVHGGIHRYIRHPLYLGTFLLIWGLWILFPKLSLLIMNMIITVYTLLAIPFEEQKLEKEFGENYINYKKKTPMIIPRFRFSKV
ncbi:MAG: isoprenylcysteine carboxylmethyltransferase family protein [Chitinophagaceae bacterium]|nr:MAG: isoprenylcysteine carboxylmethyltransferase family protein [Chitinophagaceae bacterium]